MTSSRLLEDILAQPESLSRVLAHQTGDGLASLRNAAAMLRSATRVVITGMGASFYASYPLDYLLCSLGIDSVAVEAAELLHYRQSMCKDAVVVLVSRSGESVEIEKLLHNLGGTPTIGVTNVPESVLAKRSRQMLLVGSLPDEMVAIQSYTGTVLALLLLGALVEGSFDEVRARAEALLPERTRRGFALAGIRGSP